jgi:hypothetical protein
MTLARVRGKGRVEPMTAAELADARAGVVQTLVDLGTGDGRFVRATADSHRDWFVIGVDALAEPMETGTRKAPRNALFVRASVEALPVELHAIADTVTVLLPWGKLLEGIVRGVAEVVGGIAAVAKSGARVEIVLNGEIWQASTPARYEDLPLPTPSYVADVVAPVFATNGIDLEPAVWMRAAEAKSLNTTWARKLGHGRAHPRYLNVIGERR